MGRDLATFTQMINLELNFQILVFSLQIHSTTLAFQYPFLSTHKNDPRLYRHIRLTPEFELVSVPSQYFLLSR